MHIAPISLIRNNNVNKNFAPNKVSNPFVNINSVDKVSFTANGNEVRKNQYRILLTQDIWAPKLSVKMPENEIEKEVLLQFQKKIGMRF